MEKRLVRFQCDVGAPTHELSKTLKQIQDEHQRDFQEKDELHRLNHRFGDVLVHIQNFQQINDQLVDDLKNELIHWAILPRDETLLRQILHELNAKAGEIFRDAVLQRVAEQNTSVLFRLATVFVNVQQIFRRQEENLRGRVVEHERELSAVEERQRQSDDELKSLENDFNEELSKFHQRLDDWTRLVVEKEILNVDLQSLREQINLVHALNNEEIEEWKRLLIQSNDESHEFYREELGNAIREIKRDYGKQARFFQEELEYQIEGKLQMIENFQWEDDHDEEQRTTTINETELQAKLDDFEKEQVRVNDLTKLLSNKRRLLRDEQSKFDDAQRRIREKNFEEQMRTSELRRECAELRHSFERMAVDIRFTIDDELHIYARLLDELPQNSSILDDDNAPEIDETFEGAASIFRWTSFYRMGVVGFVQFQ